MRTIIHYIQHHRIRVNAIENIDIKSSL